MFNEFLSVHRAWNGDKCGSNINISVSTRISFWEESLNPTGGKRDKTISFGEHLWLDVRVIRWKLLFLSLPNESTKALEIGVEGFDKESNSYFVRNSNNNSKKYGETRVQSWTGA